MDLPLIGRGIAVALVALGCLLGPSTALGWTGYVNNATSLVTFDTATDTVGAPIDLPGFVGSFAIAPDGGEAYVLIDSPNEILPVSLPSGIEGTPIPLAFPPDRIAITPAGDKAYVASINKGLVYPIDLRTDTAEAAIEVGSQAWAIALSPDASTAYVTTGEYPSFPASYAGIAEIDLRTEAVSQFADPDAAMGGIALSPDGATVFASDMATGELEIFDAGTRARTAVTTGFNASQLAVAPDGGVVAQSVYNDDAVALVDPATETNLGEVGIGEGPEGVAITPDSAEAFGAAYASGTVTPIDLAGRTAGAPIHIGGHAYEVAISPAQPPHAAFTADRVAPGQTTSFDASASTDADEPIVRYEWDFGDGESTITTGPTVSHTYPAVGSYQASVVETDAIGCSTTPVYTGQMVSCNGSGLARAEGTAVVAVEPPPSGGGSDSGGTNPGGTAGGGGTSKPSTPGGPGAVGTPRLARPVVRPAALKVAPGAAFGLAVAVSNRGDAVARNVRIWVAAPKRLLRLPKCVVLKRLPAGKTEKLRFKVKVAPGAKAGARIRGRVVVTAPAAGTGQSGFRVTVR
jgi:DNA-binding beta-propeller fold protein YncE